MSLVWSGQWDENHSPNPRLSPVRVRDTPCTFVVCSCRLRWCAERITAMRFVTTDFLVDDSTIFIIFCFKSLIFKQGTVVVRKRRASLVSCLGRGEVSCFLPRQRTPGLAVPSFRTCLVRIPVRFALRVCVGKKRFSALKGIGFVGNSSSGQTLLVCKVQLSTLNAR